MDADEVFWGLVGVLMIIASLTFEGIYATGLIIIGGLIVSNVAGIVLNHHLNNRSR